MTNKLRRGAVLPSFYPEDGRRMAPRSIVLPDHIYTLSSSKKHYTYLYLCAALNTSRRTVWQTSLDDSCETNTHADGSGLPRCDAVSLS